jgi:hypothetical protein
MPNPLIAKAIAAKTRRCLVRLHQIDETQKERPPSGYEDRHLAS